MIENEFVNSILRIAYTVVPKNCSLDGTKLIAAHDKIKEMINEYVKTRANINQ